MSRKHRDTDTHIPVMLPIVPMLDLSFQILFFAICLFNPSKAEGEMSMRISSSGAAKAKDQANIDLNQQSGEDLDAPTENVVMLRYYAEKTSGNFTVANFTVSLRDGNNKVDDILIDDEKKTKTIRGLIFDRNPKYTFTAEELESEKKAQEELNIVLGKLRATLEAKLKAAKEKEEELRKAAKKDGDAKEDDKKAPPIDEIKIEPNAKCKNELLVQIMDRCKQAGFKVIFSPPPDGNQ